LDRGGAGGDRDAQAPVGCVLFDLGGLIVDFRGVEALAAWLGDREPADLWARWLASPAVRAFERGELRPEAFACGLIEDFGLALDPEEVLGEIEGWVSGPTAGAIELLDELRALGPARPLVACLSNTNPVHWPRLERDHGLGDRFDRTFLSHHTGRVKPDPEAFDQVPAALGLEPARVLFFDDQPANVTAARARGLAAERALTPADCRRALVERGVLAALAPAGGPR
jgi:glucose-1-phosphatase